MKLRKLMLSVISVIIILGLMFVMGCGNNSKPSADQTGGSDSDDIADASKPSKGETVTLTYTTWGSPYERQGQGDAVKEFEKNYENIKVSFQHIPEDYETKLSTMIAANTPPDVSLLNKQTALTWGEQGKIYNLKPLIEKDLDINRDKYIGNSFIYTDSDTIVGITPCQEVFALFYNIDMFEEAGVDPPPAKAQDAWTWDEFVEVAKKLTIDQNGVNASEPGFDHTKIKQFGVKLQLWAWPTFLVINDTTLTNEEGTKFNFDDPAVAETLQRFADLINVHHVAPSPAQEKSLPAPAVALQSKKVAMDWDGQWVQLDLGAAKTNFGVGVLPKMKRSTTTLYGELEVMHQGTKHPEEAFELLKWMTNPDAVLELHSSGLWMPTFKSYYTEPDMIDKWATVKPGHPDGYVDAVMNQALEDSVPDIQYYLKNATKILSVLSPALDQLWAGTKTAEEVLKEIEPTAAAELKGVYYREE